MVGQARTERERQIERERAREKERERETTRYEPFDQCGEIGFFFAPKLTNLHRTSNMSESEWSGKLRCNLEASFEYVPTSQGARLGVGRAGLNHCARFS